MKTSILVDSDNVRDILEAVLPIEALEGVEFRLAGGRQYLMTIAATFFAAWCSMGMRPRLLIYAIASLVLLAFHAPVRAIVSLFSDCREV